MRTIIDVALLSSIFTLIATTNAAEGSGRKKRIIWARPLTDSHAPYKSPGFYAAVRTGNWWGTLKLQIARILGVDYPQPSTDHHVCGGSVLSPTVVETACHCLAEFVDVKNLSYIGAKLRHGWETYYAIFNGYFLVEHMTYAAVPGTFAFSKKFVVHEQCARIYFGWGFLSKTPYGGYYSLTHDFGFILLDRPLTFPKPHTQKVPLMSMEDIAKMYYFVQKRESICMCIGFGQYYFAKKGIPGTTSPVLQHGWRVFRNYWFCHNVNPANTTISELAFSHMDYFSLATWYCSTFFGKIRNNWLKGDSGGPITCENVYVGLVSWGYNVDPATPSIHHSLSFDQAVVFAGYEHAADYRISMTEKFNAYVNKVEWPPTVPHRRGFSNENVTFKKNSCEKSTISLVNGIILSIYAVKFLLGNLIQ